VAAAAGLDSANTGVAAKLINSMKLPISEVILCDM
jgi:hypothetical protein